MEISVDVQIRSIYLSAKQQGLATASYTRSALRPEFLSQISEIEYPWQPQKTLNIHENTLKKMIIKYSEQSVYRPLEEIKYWFAYSSGAFIEPGYPPLFYGKDKNKSISPNISAVASVGEGIAGFLAQRLYKCRKLARPNHDFQTLLWRMIAMIKLILLNQKQLYHLKLIQTLVKFKKKLNTKLMMSYLD